MNTPASLSDALIDQHLDAVLRASGSGLRYYSMQKSLDDMRAAMRAAMLAAALAHPQAESKPSAPPQGWREFLRHLIERCEHGDVNESCDDPDWRHIYVTAKAMHASAPSGEAALPGPIEWVPHPPAERDAVVREYIEARNSYEEARRPESGWAPPPRLSPNDPVVVRYRNARAALDGLIDAARQGEGNE